MFVLAEHEGNGFGTQLLQQAVNWLHESGNETIRLPTDPRTRAFKFYQDRGWKLAENQAAEAEQEGDVYLEYTGKIAPG